jgi:hypothetical protein
MCIIEAQAPLLALLLLLVLSTCCCADGARCSQHCCVADSCCCCCHCHCLCVSAVQVTAVHLEAATVCEHARAVRDCALLFLRLPQLLLLRIADTHNSSSSSSRDQLERCCQYIQYDYASSSTIEVAQRKLNPSMPYAAVRIITLASDTGMLQCMYYDDHLEEHCCLEQQVEVEVDRSARNFPQLQ